MGPKNKDITECLKDWNRDAETALFAPGKKVNFLMPPTGARVCEGIILRKAPLNTEGNWYIVEYGKRVKKTEIIHADKITIRNENPERKTR